MADKHKLVRVAVSQQVTLECQVFHDTAVPNPVGVVLFHPWACLGGSLDDHVVSSLYSAASKCGYFSTVVRYNTRGVGTSGGSIQLSCSACVEDAEILCKYILQNLQNPPQRLYLVGYSYGSCIAGSLASSLPEVAGCVSIAFPLGFWSRAILGSGSCWQKFVDAHMPKLLITADQDQFTTNKCYASYLSQAVQQSTIPVDTAAITGTDHFFVGQTGNVCQTVQQWIIQLDKSRSTS